MGGDWRRLGHRVAARRAVLGWTTTELAHRAGVGKRTVEYLEAGSKDGGYRASTLGRVENALGWDGDFERILAGREPRGTERDLLLEHVRARWVRLTAEQRRTVAALVDALLRQR